MLTFATMDDVELAKRISAVWSVFCRWSPILCCKGVPLATRLRTFAKAVNPALLWCAGSWNLRANQLPQVRSLQRQMVRKMLHFKRQT
eukprot:5043819-Lingulodinium_polyedra.AAC.1